MISSWIVDVAGSQARMIREDAAAAGRQDCRPWLEIIDFL